jgi:ribose transport system permease protein
MSVPTINPAPVLPTVDPDLRTVKQRSFLRRWLSGTSAYVFILDIVLIVVFGLLSTNQVFWSAISVQSMLLNGTEALLLAFALAILLGAGIFDLSLGANLVLSSIVGALVTKSFVHLDPVSGLTVGNPTLGILAGALAAIVTGILFGLINGLIVALLDINSLIATLGTLGIGTGVALLLSNGTDLAGLPSELQSGFGLISFVGLPLPTLITLVLGVVTWAVLRFTRFGVHTLAMGSSRAAAERAGIRVKTQLVKVSVIAGAFAGLAGLIDISRFGSTAINGHAQDALTAVTAVVIGGGLIEGGRVNLIGAIWGTVLSVVLLSGLIVIGVAPFYQVAAVGVVLVIAVAIDRARAKRLKS